MDAWDASSLIPGYGFRPTNVELINYLQKKILGHEIERDVIQWIDIQKHEPWDLPAKCHVPTSHATWHFFSSRDKKYRNGTRFNRATKAGFWKSTGKDRKIKHQNRVIGTKKTLVFHLGRPPTKERTDWIMHEYCVNEKEFRIAPDMKDTFVLCRVKKKNGWDSNSENGTAAVPFQVGNVNEALVVVPERPSNSVETEEEIRAWCEAMFDPNVTVSLVDSEANDVATDGLSDLVVNQETGNPHVIPEVCEGFSVEEFYQLLQSENQNFNNFGDFNLVNAGTFIDQQEDDIFNYDADDNWNGIQLWEREPTPSSSEIRQISAAKFQVQVNKMETRSNGESLCVIFEDNKDFCLSRILSLRETEVKKDFKGRKNNSSTFLTCVFLPAFMMAVVACIYYFKMRDAPSFSPLQI